MISIVRAHAAWRGKTSRTRAAPAHVVLKPVLGHAVRAIARRYPEIFSRLGAHQDSRFVLDPLDLPFFFLLHPDPRKPLLEALPRRAVVAHDARIAGNLRCLMRLIDGDQDADAAFFSRTLTVTGNTEAVVALRNAIDDIDRPLAAAVADTFGPVGRAILALVRHRMRRSLP